MELLTIKQAACRFNISVSKVRQLVNNGKFPAAKIGVGWRIDAEKAEGYINILMAEKVASTGASAAKIKVSRVSAKANPSYLERLRSLRKNL